MLESYDEVIEAALNLPEEQRMLLADALMSSVESPPSLTWRDAWRVEIERRSREFVANPSSGISWDEVQMNARRRAGLV